MGKSIKDDLLNEIGDRAEKIREKRKSAASTKTVESLVFEYFQQVDEAKKVADTHNGTFIDANILHAALRNLEGRIRSIYDRQAKVEVVWDQSHDESSLYNVLGVKIHWSTRFVVSHKVEPITYIDVTQMLLQD